MISNAAPVACLFVCHTSTVVQRVGLGVDGTLLRFLDGCNISKRFCLQWKAFHLLYKMRYILWVGAAANL